MPLFERHVLGYVVRRMREMAVTGVPINEIIAYVRDRCGPDDHLQYDYLSAAFLQGNVFFFVVPPFSRLTDQAERSVAKLVFEHRAEWERQRFPEMMRVRDYFAFLQFAKEQKIVISVCAANPFAGRFVGAPGFGCYDGASFVTSREVSPNQGLIAADPNDERLRVALNTYAQPVSYSDYVDDLRSQGYRVLGPETGYVIEDSTGRRLHEPYRLHGVYDADSGEPVWTSKRGERLRAGINRRLGNELVRFGPHDDWEHRNDRAIAGALCGPQLPVIKFGPQNEIDELLTVESMAGEWPYKRHWGRLYPDNPVNP